MKVYLTTDGRSHSFKKTFDKVIWVGKINNRDLKIVYLKIVSRAVIFNNTFMDCGFIDCNLSMTDLTELA
jgi:hypothetical protein